MDGQHPVHGKKEEDMARIQFGLLILVAFLGGIIGGIVSTKFISSKFAFAQSDAGKFNQKKIYAQTIIAEEYFLHEKKSTNSLDSEIPVPRAILTTESDGNPKLLMQDSNGNPRISIDLSDKDGGTLAIFDMTGKKKVLFSEKGSDGEKQLGATLAFSDDNGEPRVKIGIQADGNPFMSLNDPVIDDKRFRGIRLALGEKDEASLSLSGIEGHHRAELRVDSNNTQLSIKDINGEPRAELGNTDLAFGKDGSLKKHLPGELLVEKRPASSLVFYSANGKVLWSVP